MQNISWLHKAFHEKESSKTDLMKKYIAVRKPLPWMKPGQWKPERKQNPTKTFSIMPSNMFFLFSS